MYTLTNYLLALQALTYYRYVFFIINFNSLTDEDISGEKAIPLMYLKFQNVQHLTVSDGTACNHRLLVG